MPAWKISVVSSPLSVVQFYLNKIYAKKNHLYGKEGQASVICAVSPCLCSDHQPCTELSDTDSDGDRNPSGGTEPMWRDTGGNTNGFHATSVKSTNNIHFYQRTSFTMKITSKESETFIWIVKEILTLVLKLKKENKHEKEDNHAQGMEES